MERDDNELVAAYKRGDQRAIETLVARHLPAVYNFARRFVGIEYADDVTQETFVKVWKHIRRFDEKRNFRVWLFTIARRVSIDWTRKRNSCHFRLLTMTGEYLKLRTFRRFPRNFSEKKKSPELWKNSSASYHPIAEP